MNAATKVMLTLALLAIVSALAAALAVVLEEEAGSVSSHLLLCTGLLTIAFVISLLFIVWTA